MRNSPTHLTASNFINWRIALVLALSFCAASIVSIKNTKTQAHSRTSDHRLLSFADRVAYQRAIEEVYWRHRLWPENTRAKPSLDAVMPALQTENKVREYLRHSDALENDCQAQLTPAQLQAEINRIVRHTFQPEVLRELFQALDNDPFVIAECLARPALAERLVVESGTGEDSRLRDPEPMMRSTAVYTLPTIAPATSSAAGCTDDSWTATNTNAPTARTRHTAIWTGSEMIVWGGLAPGADVNTGGRYDPAIDSWTATSTTNTPAARENHTAIWTGTEMIVWGGGLNTGGRYNPATNTWLPTTTSNAPIYRSQSSAVWTGTEMIVWGGFSSNTVNSGGRYNPSTDSWTPTTNTNAPPARTQHTAIWTGTEMIVWGGFSGTAPLSTGSRYNPATDTWTPTTNINAPEQRNSHTAVWTGNDMIVWGGYDGVGIGLLRNGGKYNPITDSWAATSTSNAPAPRYLHSGVWTGTEMIVWGGDGGIFGPVNTGGRYDPGSDTWKATSTTNVPTARTNPTAVWTGSEVIVWGGNNAYSNTLFNTGGRYCSQNTPTSIQFSSTTYTVNEGLPSVTLTVTRTGNASAASTITFKTGNNAYAPCSRFDGVARQNCKFVRNEGTLTFAPGVTSRTFSVLILDEGYVEGNTNFPVTLNNPLGAALGVPSTATVTIIDNDSAAISPAQLRFQATLTTAQEPAASSFPTPANTLRPAKSDDDAAIDAAEQNDSESEAEDADIPRRFAGKIDHETYLRLRGEYVARRRGFEPGRPFDPEARGRAIREMEVQESRVQSGSSWLGRLFNSLVVTRSAAATWTPIGPAPLPNGDSQFSQSIAVSGRVTAIAVDPTNSNKVYLGTAQGGVWRSLDGGETWSPIFDNADSLAVGALALAPSSPSTLYVGTGEPNLCADCFFGAGLYRIDNVDTTAALVGPINPQTSLSGLTYNVFSGRAISRILVHPTDPATVFVSTTRGAGGSGVNSPGVVPAIATRGVYRSTNATSAPASVTFQKLPFTTDNSADTPGTGDADVSDIAMEPGNPSNILVAALGITAEGGIYQTTNALAATPTFSKSLSIGGGLRIALTINKVGSLVTAYAATGETAQVASACGVRTGAVRKSTDGGASWSGPLSGGAGFCSKQCFYDMTIAVSPNNPNLVYLGGQTHTICGDAIKQSSDGGSSFARDDTGMHVDAHALFFDNSGNIFAGTDGGVWKRSATAPPLTAWTNLNNPGLNTLQFEGIAVHPTDRNLMIGGTQDNGSEFQTPAGNWHQAEGGDGGYSLIDQSATDTTNVTMYHTFFSVPGFIGFDRIVNTSCLGTKNSWPARGAFGDPQDPTPGCDGTPFYLHNGINAGDHVLFYAPIALGPGAPNTFYFATDRLYRSSDRGDTMTVVSQGSITNPGNTGVPISTIAISPQDGNYRMVGLVNGQIWATSTGSSTLVDITSSSFPANPNGSTTNKFVGRAMFDPNNKTVAYVSFSYFAPAGQGIWKITNLGAAAGSTPASPNWAPAGNGIPSIPINAFAIDPFDSNNLFAGTDIGVYNSTDGGANWSPYATGLPRVAVFDLALQKSNRILRAGTHGRGVWEIPIGGGPPPPVPTSNATGISDMVLSPDQRSEQASLSFSSLSSAEFGAEIGGPAGPGMPGPVLFQLPATNPVSNFQIGGLTSQQVSDLRNGLHYVNVRSANLPAGEIRGQLLGNPTLNEDFFVLQHYYDFLQRFPDAPGLSYWINRISECGSDVVCLRSGTVGVSNAFFFELEYQQTGAYVFRLFRAAYGNDQPYPNADQLNPREANKLPSYDAYSSLRARVVGGSDLVKGQQSAANVLMNQPEFLARYPASMSGSEFISAVLRNIQTADKVGLSGEGGSLLAIYNGEANADAGRAAVLYRLANDDLAGGNGGINNRAFIDAEYNRSFVVTQYFGYLRRDGDIDGILFWLNQVNSAPLRDPAKQNAMVCSFITSAEYQQRFGPTVARSNNECPQ